ncbi:MAG: transketolase [Patescibacteria group bacterium]
MKMLTEAGSGHTGGSLGMADIFTALYFSVANIDPKKPGWENRDKIVLSNGHICPVLYATLARRGFFPLAKLKTLRKLGSPLQGHPHYGELPGVENSGGPLGQGISQAVGMALAAKLDKKTNRIFCLMSDGELNEGQCWEAFLLAAKHKLDNLIIIVDRNKIQLSGTTEDILPLEPLKEKFQAFNFKVLETDGHKMDQIIEVFKQAKNTVGQPTVILAHTTLGKGVSFMENDYRWHGKAPNKEESERALKELERD